MRNGKKGLLMLGCSLLTAVLMIGWPVKETLNVETAVVQRGELVQTLLMSGQVCYSDQQPCISLKSGRIAKVFVEQGQEISKGDLLFKLDSAAEERALASLHEKKYAQKTAIAHLDGTVSAFTLQNELEWLNAEKLLLEGIAASQIRAEADGIMEAVYVQEGEYVPEMTLLGTLHGAGLYIAASAYAGEANHILPDAAAVVSAGQENIPVRLVKKMNGDEARTQIFCFEAIKENGLNALSAGDMVRLEVTKNTEPISALIPISAIDADDRVWVVQNGKAYSRSITLGEYSRTHAAAELTWVGETVILHPETYDLVDGTAVQVKK